MNKRYSPPDSVENFFAGIERQKSATPNKDPQPKKKIFSKPLMMPGKKFSDHIRRHLK